MSTKPDPGCCSRRDTNTLAMLDAVKYGPSPTAELFSELMAHQDEYSDYPHILEKHSAADYQQAIIAARAHSYLAFTQASYKSSENSDLVVHFATKAGDDMCRNVITTPVAEILTDLKAAVDELGSLPNAGSWTSDSERVAHVEGMLEKHLNAEYATADGGVSFGGGVSTLKDRILQAVGPLPRQCSFPRCSDPDRVLALPTVLSTPDDILSAPWHHLTAAFIEYRNIVGPFEYAHSREHAESAVALLMMASEIHSASLYAIDPLKAKLNTFAGYLRSQASDVIGTRLAPSEEKSLSLIAGAWRRAGAETVRGAGPADLARLQGPFATQYSTRLQQLFRELELPADSEIAKSPGWQDLVH